MCLLNTRPPSWSSPKARFRTDLGFISGANLAPKGRPEADNWVAGEQVWSRLTTTWLREREETDRVADLDADWRLLSRLRRQRRCERGLPKR